MGCSAVVGDRHDTDWLRRGHRDQELLRRSGSMVGWHRGKHRPRWRSNCALGSKGLLPRGRGGLRGGRHRSRFRELHF